MMENLLALLLEAQNVAHIHHWRTKSFAMHLALGELYEQLSEFADELAEMYMGDIGNNDIGPVEWESRTGWDKSSPIGFISQLHEVLEKLKSSIPQKDWLINKYEELQAAVATVKYKMENLK